MSEEFALSRFSASRGTPKRAAEQLRCLMSSHFQQNISYSLVFLKNCDFWANCIIQKTLYFIPVTNSSLQSPNSSNRPDQGAHLFNTSPPYMTKGHSHHHRYGYPNPRLHLGFSTNVMLFKTKAVIYTAIDSLQ